MADRVLILGDDTRSFLAAVRSLGRLGLEVHVAPDNWSSPALKSKFIARKVSLPPYNVDPEAWGDALAELQALYDYTFILPCDERGIIPLKHHQGRFSQTHLGIVNDAASEIFFNKVKTRECAQTLGIAVAEGRVLEPKDSAAELIKSFGLPLAIKPAQSFSADNVHHRRSVRLAATPGAVAQALEAMDNWRSYFVEAVRPGRGIGVSVLARDGDIHQWFQHERVHEPKSGGGSSYRKSVPLDPRLARDVEKLARAAQLTGLAMFEFRRHADTGQHILLEVNARLWGSVPLAIAAGVDFPALYYQMATQDRIAARAPYQVPVYARNLVNDLNAIVAQAAAMPQTGALADFATMAFSYWRTFLGRDRSDTYATDDPRPHREDRRAFRVDLGDRLRRKMPFLARRAALEQLTQLDQVIAALPPTPHIVLLCRGNICRSPFAAKLLLKKAKARGIALSVDQAGTLPKAPRRAPKLAIESARRFGVALSRHKSGHSSSLDLTQADLILHFDPIIEAELRSGQPSVDTPCFNLAYLAPTPLATLTIADPIDGDATQFDAVYRQIDVALDRFLERLKAAQSAVSERERTVSEVQL